MVPRRGLEPPRPCERQHLKLVRLPIPPPGHGSDHLWQAAALKGRVARLVNARNARASAPRHDRARRKSWSPSSAAADSSAATSAKLLLKSGVRVRVAQRDPRQRLFHPAARPGRPVRLRRRPTSPTRDSVRHAVEGASAVDQPVRRLRPQDAARSMSRARATSPRPRASRREALVHISAIGADPQLAVRLRPDQGRRRGGGPRGFPERDDHPPVAGVRAGGRSHQPLRRHGAAAVPSGHRRQAQLPAGLCPRPRARRSPWPRSIRRRYGGKTYEIGGPQVMTMVELHQRDPRAHRPDARDRADCPTSSATLLSRFGLLPGRAADPRPVADAPARQCAVGRRCRASRRSGSSRRRSPPSATNGSAASTGGNASPAGASI